MTKQGYLGKLAFDSVLLNSRFNDLCFEFVPSTEDITFLIAENPQFIRPKVIKILFHGLMW